MSRCSCKSQKVCLSSKTHIVSSPIILSSPPQDSVLLPIIPMHRKGDPVALTVLLAGGASALQSTKIAARIFIPSTPYRDVLHTRHIWGPTIRAGVTAHLQHLLWLSVGLILPCPQNKVLVPFILTKLQFRSSPCLHYVLCNWTRRQESLHALRQDKRGMQKWIVYSASNKKEKNSPDNTHNCIWFLFLFLRDSFWHCACRNT